MWVSVFILDRVIEVFIVRDVIVCSIDFLVEVIVVVFIFIEEVRFKEMVLIVVVSSRGNV